MNVSVVIITKNEEQYIADCIASVSFAQEILVIDSGSTDKTLEIAQLLGATIITNPWQGYGQQKNLGASKVKTDWILFLDADERVSPELQSRLQAMSEEPEYAVYWITVEDIFFGKRMKHLVGHNPRLVKKGSATWNANKVHEQLVYENTGKTVQYKDAISGEIQEPIIHISYTSISEYVKKMHMYTTLDAQGMYEKNRHRSGRVVRKTFLLPYILAFRQLGKLLFYRKGIFDGWQGIMWSFLSAYYEFEMGKKYLAL